MGRAFTKVSGWFCSFGRADEPEFSKRYAKILRRHADGEMVESAKAPAATHASVSVNALLLRYCPEEQPRLMGLRMHEITQILQKVEAGDPSAAEGLLPLVYEELRRVASEKMAQEMPGQTLQATALVHEAWLRLVDVDYVQSWSSRRHFFAAAAEAMRRILVDKARRRNRHKHGADRRQVTIQLERVSVAEDDSLLETLDEALSRFEQVDAVACELVKLRYFTGLSLADAAQALELPSRTADRLWAYAKAWLLREIQREVAEAS